MHFPALHYCDSFGIVASASQIKECSVLYLKQDQGLTGSESVEGLTTSAFSKHMYMFLQFALQ